MALHKQIEQGRHAQRLTQAELALQTGLTRMTIQRIEAGKTDPKVSTLEALAKVLGLTVMLVPSPPDPALESEACTAALPSQAPAASDNP